MAGEGSLLVAGGGRETNMPYRQPLSGEFYEVFISINGGWEKERERDRDREMQGDAERDRGRGRSG